MRSRKQEGPLVIAVGGGKGGVGKSVIAANLALSMAKLGARVVAVDADLGSSNLHTLFGIDHPGQTLQALIDGRVDSLQEVAIGTGFPRLEIVPGSIAVPGAANLQHARKQKLLRHVARLDCDAVVVDCGAGIHYNVLDFFTLADARLLVATAQLVSLQNAYGFLKASAYRVLRRQAAELGAPDLLDRTSTGSETETVRQVFSRVEAAEPNLSEALRPALQAMRVSLLGNQLAEPREINALHALSRMIGDFLTLHVPVVGGLSRSARVHDSVTRRRPFVAEGRSDPESRLFTELAELYLRIDVGELRAEREAHAAAGEEPATPEPPAAAPASLPVSLGRYERAHERIDVDWPARVVLGSEVRSARVRDISRGGLRLEFLGGRGPAPGSVVRVEVDLDGAAVAVAAKVVHLAAMRAGCSFDPAPPEELLSRLLSHARLPGAPATAGPDSGR